MGIRPPQKPQLASVFLADDAASATPYIRLCEALGPFSPESGRIIMTLPEDLFFARTGMERGRVQRIVDDALKGADDGELFLEYRQTESFSFDDGRLRAATYDTTQGFGLRAVAGEATGYAHASELSEAAIKRAAEAVTAVRIGHSAIRASSMRDPREPTSISIPTRARSPRRLSTSR
jgi:hypothetical protein